MPHYYFHLVGARELHETRLREAERERLARVARGDSPNALRRVRGGIATRIALLAPRLRQRAALHGS